MIKPEECIIGRKVFYAPGFNGKKYPAIIASGPLAWGAGQCITRLEGLDLGNEMITYGVADAAFLSRLFLTEDAEE